MRYEPQRSAGLSAFMHEYLYEADLVRVGVITGIVVSTLLYERFHLTTGGAVVPGYLALFVLAPLAIAVTIGTAYVTYRIVNGPLASRMILYGRRKFEVEVLIGLGFVSVVYAFAQVRLGLPPLATAVYGIGFVLPGLIAHDMFRQGPLKTVAVLAAAIAVVAAILFILVTLADLGPPRVLPPPLHGVAARGYEEELLLPAVVVSVVAGLAIFRGLGLRTGGFVTAAYLALVAPDPRDLLFTAAIALATYMIANRLLSERLLLFGRRKVAMMVLLASVLARTTELAVIAVTSGLYQPWQGFNAITLMVPGLIANDMDRQGVERTAWGVGIAILAVIGTMDLITAALDALNPYLTALQQAHP
jgi:poly-gamma-glutamate biosynthesis protein PgsC/CapC